MKHRTIPDSRNVIPVEAVVFVRQHNDSVDLAVEIVT
jgi:hypothetical protein